MSSERPPYISAIEIATLAHNLRNALTVMAGSIDALRAAVAQTPANDQRFAELDSALDGAFGVGRDMLALVRPDGREAGLIDVNELIAHTRDMIERIAGGSIGVTIHLGATVPAVTADVVELEWLLLNLVWNAVDAMPNGGRLLLETVSIDIPPDVRTAGGYKGRHHVRLTVSDSGAGMSPEVMSHALEPFFSTRAGKAGLGLTSVATTVRRLGGVLHLRHNTPRGTSVDAYLPTRGQARLQATESS